ncbi:MAG: TIGR03809 family protein [Variibacter sp.]|nr:TIGR03809 family protein [Variibacter sp.]
MSSLKQSSTQGPEAPRTPDEMARRWQELAERRRAHLLEIYRSGRWRLYYTEDQLMAQMRDAVHCAEEWSQKSGEPVAENDNAVAPLREAAE